MNSYKGWTTAIFVDLRNSTVLFRDKDEAEITRQNVKESTIK